jgi:serine/threonine protein kinase/Tfp pilus assembly protein PilF
VDDGNISMADSDSGFNPMAGLADEFLERYRRGERPALSDYARQHPKLADQIEDLFPALVMLEDARPVPRPLTGPIGPARSGPPLHRLGEYRIVREIGRGGMGIVYEAEQESLGRRVALKVLPPGALENSRQIERFRREARAAARLHHTNIVPVFGVGEEGQTHYYVMQHIEGRPLDDVLDELRRLRAQSALGIVASREDLDDANDSHAEAVSSASIGPPSSLHLARSLWGGRFRDPIQSDLAGTKNSERDDPSDEATSCASPTPNEPMSTGPPNILSDPNRSYARGVAYVGVQVAEALEYSAGQGILHRDVKPSNLLLDVFGTVWLTDFGLAKATDTPDLTHTGDLFGTLRYLAPERFHGQADVRSDVYALGLTLYELLAMRPAFDDHGQADLVSQITAANPRRLDEIDVSLPRDLVTIIHKAIAKDPADRYQTPGALAEDLRRFLDDRPIAARRLSLVEKSWRWCRRNPTDAALVMTILALVGVAIGMGIWVQRQHAERRAEAAGREGRARQAVEADLDQAATLLHEGRWPEAKAVLMHADGWLEDTRSRILPQRLKGARAELDLVDKLEGNRMSRAGLFRNRSDLASVAQGYAAAFEDAGLVLEYDLAVAEIRDSPIREELVAALDDWALVTPDANLRARLLRVARLADPDPVWRDRVRDPTVWGDRRALELLAKDALGALGAISPPQLLTTLGVLLKQAGGDPEPLLRAAQQLRPADLWFNYELGHLLRDEKPEEAVGFCRAALVVRPRSSAVHDNLGSALAAAGRVDEALNAYNKAMEIDPKSSAVHNNLGTVFWKIGRRHEADDEYRKAIDLNPRSSAAHHNLGNILAVAGRTEEAIAAYRRSIELNPDEGALAQKSLASVLLGQGSVCEARAAFRQCLDLLSPNQPMRPSATDGLNLCDRLLALGERLPALLHGKELSTDAMVLRDLALLSQYGKRWNAAARFFAAAFLAQPDLADDLVTADRYNAACYAALAGCDQGNHAEPVTGAEQAYLRHQAREWLRADLTLRARQLESASAATRLDVRDKIRFWKHDVDLAGIRDADALEKLPATERQECTALWAAVDAQIEKASAQHRP